MTLALEVLRATALALIQDGGRPGLLSQGVPPGGALIPELLAVANRALGNPPGAAGVEAYGDVDLEARSAGVLSIDGAVHRLEAGERVRLERPLEHRARYLAVPGGIDVPLRLGSRSTLALAGLGGFEGRALRRGDRLPATDPGDGMAAGCAPPAGWDDPSRPIRFVAGPDLHAFEAGALELLAEASFVVSPSSDRVGTRLLGSRKLPRVGGDAEISTPMLAGALQVPSSGEPIALGPDHPTVGGYPVIAVVVRADLGALFARRPGTPVRLAPISLEEGRRIDAAWNRSWKPGSASVDHSGA